MAQLSVSRTRKLPRTTRCNLLLFCRLMANRIWREWDVTDVRSTGLDHRGANPEQRVHSGCAGRHIVPMHDADDSLS